MRVNLQAQGLWEAVDTGDVPFHEDRQALSAILRAVPAEMLRPLAEKDNAKDAWDALKSMRVGADRVKQSRAQKLLQNFESMRFKSGESVEDFSLRLQGVVSDLRLLGEDVSEEKVVRKLLRVVPRRYRQMALSIETLIDLTTLSIEDLTGRLLTVDDHPDSDGEDAGQALFGEKEGTKWASKDGGQPSRDAGTRGSASGSRQHGRGGRGRDGNGGDTKSRPSQPPGRDVTKDKCRYCGKLGHWAKDCRKAKRDREKLAQANLLVVEPKQADGEEEPTLLMAQVCELSPVQEPEHVDGEIALNEEHALALLREEGEPVDPEWILDTGASNHMTGAHSAFSELDTSVRGFVKFGDASRVRIEGRGTVLFACKNGDHCALTGVYYIPRLRSNMVSLGQLDNRRTGDTVAIKCFHPPGGDLDDGQQQQQHDAVALAGRERDCLAACRGSPSVVQLLDVAADPWNSGDVYLVMEFVGTRTLRDLTVGRPFSEAETRALMRQLLAGAAAIHGAGLIHRDVKPANILVGPGCVLKYCDFGDATPVMPPYEEFLVGTLRFTSPEEVAGDRFYGQGVDMWALGCVMAELLTGRFVFTSSETCEDHVLDLLDLRECDVGAEDSPAFGGLPGLSPAGREVLAGLLAFDHRERMTAEAALEHRWFTAAADSPAVLRRLADLAAGKNNM
jgi:cell division cycle 2-like protein